MRPDCSRTWSSNMRAMIAMADKPACNAGYVDLREGAPGCRSPSDQGDGARALGAPVRSPTCPRMMLAAIPVRKPIITECETKRVQRPNRKTAGQDHGHAGEAREEEQSASPPVR